MRKTQYNGKDKNEKNKFIFKKLDSSRFDVRFGIKILLSTL
jgi:hypothetical protein